MVLRGEGQGPFFRYEHGKGLTRRVFVAEVKKALVSQGMDAVGISGHSFRIGAATTAAMNGASDEDVKALGRWKSREYKGYVRTGSRAQATSAQWVTMAPEEKSQGEEGAAPGE